MKRTLTYALSAVLGGVILTPAMAQDNFPDAPEVHWAYEALKNMKAAGLLVGYPDGLFRGNRPASRYEMAVALHALYQHLKNMSTGLEGQIKSLDERIRALGGGTTTPPPTGGVTQAQLQELRNALNQATTTLNGMRAWGDDIANLKRMATTFERELASMGVDVEAMKKGLNDLAARVTALEKIKLPVDIHGTFDLALLGGYSEDRRFGITKGGRPTGVHRSTGDPTGIGHDLNIWHEGTLSLATTNDSGPKAKATMVMGNTMAQGSGSFSSGGREAFNMTHHLEGTPFGDSNETDIWFHNFEIMFDTSVFGQDMKARAGRVGYQTNSGYFFKRPDTTPEYHNKLWDDGNWVFDGVVLGFNFGNVGLDIVGGRQSGRYTSDGSEINEMWAGQYGHPFEPGGDTGNNPSRPRGIGSNMNGIMVDTHLGFVFNIPIMEKGHLNLNYFLLDSDSTTTLGGSPLVTANRASVFGGELKLPIGGRVNLVAGYSQTNLSTDSDTSVDEDNAAWWIKGMYNGGDNWGVHLGYRQIDPQFYAPGSWGRIGIWTNPTDVEGFSVGGWFNLSDRTSISANIEMLKGRDTNLGGSAGLGEDDEVNSYKIRIEHKINDQWSAMLGGEFVEWDVANRGPSSTPDFVGGSPRERWYDLGFKFKFNENSWWSFVWQISDYDSKGVFGFNPFASMSGESRATGGVITSQLSIKY